MDEQRYLLSDDILIFLEKIDVIPFLLSPLISRLASDLMKKRTEIFFEELKHANELLKESRDKDGFLHRFLITYEATLRTERAEKIRMFARILINSVHKQDFTSEKPELYIQILLSLTPEDLEILDKIYKGVQKAYPDTTANKDEIEYQVSLSIINNSYDLFGMTREMLIARLIRLSSMGLYLLATTTGEVGGIGRLTNLYHDFSDWIVDTAKISNPINK